jgi:hypothetical protein
MCDVAGWPVGAGAEVCAKTVPTPIAEQRSIALTSDFIVKSFSNDDAPTPINRRAYHYLRSLFTEYGKRTMAPTATAAIIIVAPLTDRILFFGKKFFRKMGYASL